MKTTNTTKWIVALLLVTIISSGKTAIAQIKIAGDDYSQKLTESKSYYDRDVDFDKYFPAVSPIERFSRLFSSFSTRGHSTGYENKYVNLTGDTVFLCEGINMPTNWMSYSFTVKNNIGTEMSVIPAGYYVISGYVFCKEGMDSIRIASGMKPYGGNEDGSVRELRERQLVAGDRFGTYALVDFLKQIALTPIDDDNTIYYVDVRHFDDNVFLLRYYNQAVAFIGKEVVLKKYDQGGLVNLKEEEIIKDGITGDLVKLEDEKYEVIDVVLKKDRHFNSFFTVLKGEKSGSFALKTNSVYYSYSSNEIVRVAKDEQPSDWFDIVKKYNNMMDIPVLRGDYHCRFGSHCDGIALIIEENNWKTLEARAKKMNEKLKEELELQQRRNQKEKENKEAECKKQMIAKYGSPFGEYVANKQLAVGMTKEMCRDAWGRPINTYRTTTSFGQSEVWCYDYKTRVYFYDGKVTRIDN